MQYYATYKRVIGGPNSAPVLLPEFAYETPPGSPAAQAGMDVFSPPTNAGINPSGPSLSVVTANGGPNDAISIFGDNFTSTTYFQFYGQSSINNGFLVSDPLQARKITPVALTSNTTLWALPANLPVNAPILVWPTTPTAVGRPLLINKAYPWWIGDIGTAANPELGTGYEACIVGHTICLYGENLCKPIAATGADGGTATIASGVPITFSAPTGLSSANVAAGMGIYCVPDDPLVAQGNSITGTIGSYNSGTGTLVMTGASSRGSGAYTKWNLYITGYAWIRLSTGTRHQTLSASVITGAEPYRLQFTMPSTITDDGNGTAGTTTLAVGDTLDVWVQALGGNVRGWAKFPVQVTVETAAHLGMDYETTSNVYTMPAPGGAGADDYTKFTDALTALGSSAGVIVLAGDYLTSLPITPVHNVRFRWNGSTSSSIKPHSTFAGSCLIDATHVNCTAVEIKNITVDILAKTPTFSVLQIQRFINANVTGPGFACVDMSNKRGYIYSSNFTGGTTEGILRLGRRQYYVDSCNFHGSAAGSGCDGAISGNPSGLAVTRCTFDKADSGAGAFRARPFVSYGNTYNVYFADNNSSMKPENGDVGGEQVLFHDNTTSIASGLVTGYSTSGGVSNITIDNVVDNTTGFGSNPVTCFVTSGKGVGQCGRWLPTNPIVLGAGKSGTIPLDVLFLVDLDSTSFVTFQQAPTRVAVHNSTMSCGATRPTGTAACMVNIGMGFDIVVDNVSGTNMEYGVQFFANESSLRRPKFNVLLKNLSAVTCNKSYRMSASAIVNGDAVDHYALGIICRNFYGPSNVVASMQFSHRDEDLIAHSNCRYAGAPIGVTCGATSVGTESMWNTNVVGDGTGNLHDTLASGLTLAPYGTSTNSGFTGP